MNPLSFAMEPGRSLQTVLGSMPPSMRTILRRGFELLASIPQRHYGDLLETVKHSVIAGGPLRVQRAVPNIEEDDWSRLVSSAGLLTMAIVVRGETPDAFVSALVKAELLDDNNRVNVLRFANNVQNDKEELKKSWERAQLVSEVLPALTRVETTVDLRFGFERDAIQYSVPILLVHLDTDSYQQEIWFQLTRPQLEGFIADLNEALLRMKAAEAWTDGRSV